MSAKCRNGAARASGFSLHSGIAMEPAQREELERLYGQANRPPVAEERLALTPSGHVRDTLKTCYRDDGSTHVERTALQSHWLERPV